MAVVVVVSMTVVVYWPPEASVEVAAEPPASRGVMYEKPA